MARDGSFVDLFCGAGLLSAGFIAEGFWPKLALDLSDDAVRSYRRNVSPVAVKAPVNEWSDVPETDILIAGPPCQGFSTLGQQNPRDVRNALALSVVKWADLSGAKIVVVENVPPFITSRHGRSLRASLRQRGYEVFVWVLEAADFGTPQLRKRAFTVASKVGRIAPPIPMPARLTAGEALGRPIAFDDPMHRWPVPAGIAAERIALVPFGGDKRDIMKAAPDLCPPSWQRVGCQATDVWGRINPDNPANTIRCTFQNPSKGRYLHPTEPRTISLREGARLQGVPDEWVFEGKNYPVARQIGNGVPIPLARAVAAAIRTSLGLKNASDTLVDEHI